MRCNQPQAKFVGFLFLIAFSAILFASEIAAQQVKLVETVDIQGNRRNRDISLLEAIKTRPGDVFDEKQIQKDLQSLLKLDLFDPKHTKVFTEAGQRGGVNVYFQVRELSLISEFNITGIREAEKTEIYEMLAKQLNFQTGKPFEPQKVRSAVQIIRQYLAKRGFLSPKINVKEEEISFDKVKITFEIEGERDVQFLEVSRKK